jgi:hypothetical protein
MRPEQRVVEVGETDIGWLTAQNIPHEVIEVTDTTNAAGVANLTTPGMTATVRRIVGVPIETTGDPFFRVFVVQCSGAYAGLYFLGIAGPYGMHLQPDVPTAGPLNETFTTAWKPDTIILQNGGVPVVGARASILFTRQTANGVVTLKPGANMGQTLQAGGGTYVDSLAQPRIGQYMTGAAGVLYENLPGIGLRPLAFANWPGNHQKTNPQGVKVYEGGDAPSEYMIEMKVYYLGEELVIGPGVGGTLNVQQSTLAVTGGTAGDIVEIQLEGAGDVLPLLIQKLTLDGAGAATFNNVHPGRWALCTYAESAPGITDHTKVAPRQWITIGHGEAAAATLPAYQTAGVGNTMCLAYSHGAEPLVGEQMMISTDNGTTWAAYGGVTDANGKWEFAIPPPLPAVTYLLGITSVRWGHSRWDQISAFTAWEFCMSGPPVHPFIVHAASWVMGLTVPQAAWWYGTEADHNLIGPVEVGLRIVETNGASPWIGYFRIADGGHVVGDVPPRSLSTSTTRLDWTVEDLDGNVFEHIGVLPDTPYMDTNRYGPLSPYKQVVGPATQGRAVGGRLNGNVTHNSTPEQIDNDSDFNLGEAGRMLERGGYDPKIEVIVETTDHDVTERVGATIGQACPYCLNAIWRDASLPSAGLLYGYCLECGRQAGWPAGATAAHTYFDTPTTAAPADAKSYIRNWSCDDYSVTQRELDYHYPPVDYLEDANHLLTGGRGMNQTLPAPRWFVREPAWLPGAGPFEYHAKLGDWNGVVFTQGVTAQDIATDMGLEGTLLVRPKIIMEAGHTHTGPEPVPVGVYADGRIDVYEGVACVGECDNFTQAFWETKFGAVFPADWWQADNLADMIARRPEGSQWIAAGGADVPWIWDMVVLQLDPTTLHAAILHDKTGPYRYAHSNPYGNELGYMGAISYPIVGWFHWGGAGSYRLHYTRADDAAATVDFIIPDGFAGRTGVIDWEDVLFLTDRNQMDADEADSPWPSLILCKSVDDIEPLSGATNNQVWCVADTPAVRIGPIKMLDRKRVTEVAVYGPLLGAGGLHIAWHDVAQAQLVTDTLFTDDVGYWKIQRGAGWSSRYMVPNSDDTRWANTWVTHGRTELIEGDGFTRTRLAASLDGDWNLRDVIDRDYKAPMGILALGMLYMTAYRDGVQYLLRRQRWDDHDAVATESVLTIAASDEVPAGLAILTPYQALACAIQRESATYIYWSHDNGQTWEEMATVAGMLYPALYCDGRYLWHAGYVASSLQGAPGRVRVSQFDTRTPNLELVGGPVDVGPSDAGRPGILRNPLDWELLVLTPKTSDWTVSGATPGIAEFTSTDQGASWSLVTIHAV